MRYFYAFIIFSLVLLVNACNNTKTKASNSTDPLMEMDLSKGFHLTESYCFSCHNPDASIDNRIAPPMVAVKKHYLTDGQSEESFTKDLIAFVNNPNENISKMPGAISKFNLMPKMNYSEADLQEIAHYIYTSELEKPEWFEEHYQQEKKKYGQQETSELNYAEQGMQHAMATKAILGKNLMRAIQEKGTVGALSFCNIEAFPLTDSMAQVQGVNIKRVSDLERNPKNKANGEELAIIMDMKKQLSAGEKTTPKIVELENKVLGYYPILMNTMCLQCHGAQKDIEASTLAKLNELYPKDKAIGYGENELRGIWVVEMKK